MKERTVLVMSKFAMIGASVFVAIISAKFMLSVYINNMITDYRLFTWSRGLFGLSLIVLAYTIITLIPFMKEGNKK
jgi:hypothetical protein